MPAFGPCRRACGCAGLFFLPPDSAVLSVFAALLFAPSFFPSSVFLPVFRLSSRLPFFSCRPAFPTARISHCPCFSQPASRQLCRAVLLRLYSVWFFFCHFLFFRSSSIARRLLSVAHCLSLAAHCLSLAARCPSLAACCPSLVAPFIVHRPPFVVRRPLSVARCAVHRSSPAACWRLPVPRRPSRRASFRCRSVRITAFVSAESRPACLRELLAVSFRSGFRRSVFPQKCVRPPYLGRRAVSDKITPCVLLSGAIFPARPAILLTIWQRLPFGTTFVQIQGVTGAPDPQGGRTPAARKENGKNINN